MDTISVDDRELPSTAEGFRAYVRWMVSQLKGMARFLEGTCLEKGTIPFLGITCQDHTELYRE